MRISSAVSQSAFLVRSQSRPTRQDAERADDKHRSNYDSLPGEEFPAAVYRSIVIAFAWMMVAAWLAFGGTAGTDLDLAIATVLFIVFLALPIIMHRTAVNRHGHEPQPALQRFRSSRVDIATGSLTGREAWLEVLLIPIALALAATLIGGAYVFLS
jgi:uncharacterized membrane protein YtjA (UPF0391 family)